MSPFTRFHLAGWAACGGLVVGYSAGVMMHFPPFRVQKILQNSLADVAVILLGGATLASLMLWSQDPDHSERRALVVPIAFIGVVAVALNVVAPAMGWWSGLTFAAPWFPLAVLTGLRAMLMISVLLLSYRWLGAHNIWLARGAYGVILALLVPGTIWGDGMVMRSGAITFGNGYTVGKDLILGEVVFMLPPVMFEILQRSSSRTSGSKAARPRS